MDFLAQSKDRQTLGEHAGEHYENNSPGNQTKYHSASSNPDTIIQITYNLKSLSLYRYSLRDNMATIST